jgi:IS5 family transposase
MQGKLSYNSQLDIFKPLLSSIVSNKIPIVKLTEKVDWILIENEFGKFYSSNGRPSVPTRTMVGLLMLKSMFSVSDEDLIPSWIQNPYWQYFCGEQYFRDSAPCDPSDLVHFRKRIGKMALK